MMNNHPFATHNQNCAFKLCVSSLQPTYILSQYLLKAKAGRGRSPRFCCFLPSGSPAGSTSALHPHPVQAPQNWPCTTGPDQLLSVPKRVFQLRSIHSTVEFFHQVLRPVPPQPSTLIQHQLLKTGPAEQAPVTTESVTSSVIQRRLVYSGFLH